VVLSCAVSLDGYLDDAGPERLVLSDAADLDRVDAERAASDAILVGANTIRRDDPRLLVRSPERRAARLARGTHPDPVKVTITASGALDPSSRFFTTGDGRKLVYATSEGARALGAALGPGATVVGLGADADPAEVLADLARRGVRRLFVEGGGRVLTEFLTRGLADELQMVVAPFFVGDAAAPRFALPGRYPYGPGRPMRLAEVRRIGDLVLLDYLLNPEEPGARTEP
jgi:5-amino-6-(5-phosphoribosylamino)uracil reductase